MCSKLMTPISLNGASVSRTVNRARKALPFAGFHSFANDNVNPARLRRRQSVDHHCKNIAAQRPNKNGTLARRDAGWRRGGKQKRRQAAAPTVQQRQSKRMRVRRPHDKERRKCASGLANKRRTLNERSGQECVLRKSRSFDTAPDHHPKGQD